MPTTETGKTGRTEAASKGDQDAIALLTNDHREVERLFETFEKARADKRKAELVGEILLALKVHTQIEEELFYPAARQALKAKDEDMIDEAVVEHAAAKDLMAEIEGMDPDDDLYDAKVKVLSEQIEHHVGEEEGEMFPALRKTDMDLRALGARMAARKSELMDKLGKSARH
ncbi:MAG TPA: hemerythrin domain-containing protein [Caulobacteraceae bacterium]|nr:hemerythrin domain-containing protein [Caulobacteraceae bacterium]